jgi:hypothetical protein
MVTILGEYLKTLLCLAAIGAVTATVISIAIVLLKTDFVALLFG